MNKKKVLSMMMTAVLTFTSVVPQPALYANAEGDVIIEEIGEEDPGDETVSNDVAEAVSENATEGVSDNDAEGESVSENNTETVSDKEAVSENEADEKVLPEGIKGMPEGYTLSETEACIKADMVSHDVPGELKNAVAGVDYVEDQVYCTADTEEVALQIADAYSIELVEYNYKVAIFSTKDSGLSVPEIVALGADPGLELPPLSPDYISYESRQDIDGSARISSIDYDPVKNETLGWEEVIQKYIPHRDPYLYPDNMDYQWWHDMMDTYPAWGAYRGVDFSDSGISVALIGSGIDVTHEELQGHIEVVDISSGTGTQGTQMAGIIGATANNGQGGAGVAPGVQIIGYDMDMSSARIVQAINAAVSDGCKIVCMGNRGAKYDSEEVNAINAAYKAEITMLAAAGDNRANDHNYPAQYDHVISVGAVQQDGKRASFSTYGKGIVDVYAPGVEMSDLSFTKAQGSSMACAAAAGACALYMSIMGPVDPDRMSMVLTKNTLKCSSDYAGAGIVNVARMLEAETTAPRLELRAADDSLIATIESGESATLNAENFSYLKIIPMSSNGKVSQDKNTQMVFSLSKYLPSFDKDGNATDGTFLTTDGKIDLQEFVDAIGGEKGQIMVRAACVTGVGVISKVTTITVTLPQRPLKKIYIGNIPKGNLVPGAVWQLQSYIDRGPKISRFSGAKWEITSGTDIATINSRGLIKAKKGKLGEVGIKCSYTENGVTKVAETTITIADRAPVKSIKVSDSKVKLSFPGFSEKQGINTSKKLTVTNVINTKNADITGDEDLYFSWLTSNAAIARVEFSGNGREATIVAKRKGSATITCMALDGSNKKIKIKVRVISLVDSIYIYGQSCIAVDSTTKYKAVAVGVIDYLRDIEYKPDDKRVIWSLRATGSGEDVKELPGVKIDSKSGKVTVTAKNIDSFYVAATANDGGGAVTTERIQITDKKAGSMILRPVEEDPFYLIKCDKKGGIKTIRLHTVDASATADVMEDCVKVKAVLDIDTQLKWNSSNENVAGISCSGDTVSIRSRGAGNSKITCYADDGSGRKASFIVKVIVPVSNLMLTNDALLTEFNGATNEPFARLGIGNTTKTKVTAGDAYGKPANVKVTWTYELVETRWDSASSSYITSPLTEEVLAKAKDAKLFNGSNGSLSFHKDYAAALASAGLSDHSLAVRLTAAATDGSSLTASKLFKPAERIEKVWFTDTKTIEVNAKESFGPDDSIFREMKAEYTCLNKSEKEISGFAVGSVSSSNPDVATAYLDKTGYVKFSYGSQKGTAAITCEAVDGSRKKCTIKIVVK